MDTGILHLHNLLRWLVLLFAVWTIFQSVTGLSGKKTFTSADKRPAMLLMITADVQFLLGLVLYFMRGWWNVLMTGGFMEIAAQRFWTIEHMIGMIFGIILIHIGYSATKKNITDKGKFKRLFWFTLIGLIVIIATIPWPFREAVGRGLFPGMS